MDEFNDFASPPAEDFDAPIILGAPPPEVTSEDPSSYVGDANEAPMDSEPIIPPVSSSSEPTPMQKWNEEWQTTLLARKEEENQIKAQMIEKAKQDLENFQKERELKRETKMAKNREDEQAKLEAIEADLENDNSWQRVCKMIELTQDSNDKAEDVKRMRDIIIALKNEPAKAEALSN